MVDMVEKPTVDLEGVVLVGRGEAGRSGELEVLRIVGMGIRDISQLPPTCSDARLLVENCLTDRTTIPFRLNYLFSDWLVIQCSYIFGKIFIPRPCSST